MPDRINIFLVFASFALALALPFELFLFSYAVLGPLHYLTQLHWLREKSFFIPSGNMRVAGIAALLIVPATLYELFRVLHIDIPQPFFGLLKTSGVLIPVAFLLAVFLVLSRGKLHWLAATAIVLLSFALYSYLPGYTYITIALLPTLVHVYLFTLLFVFYGAKKSRSAAGMWNGVLLLIVPFVLWFMPARLFESVVNLHSEMFSDNDVFGVQGIVYRLLGGEQPFLFSSVLAVKIQVFIAFAYTYHYLNWFSKTGVIGWTKGLTPFRIGIVVLLWLGIVFMYWVDYQVGISLLFFLSLLHVVLEFPLNAVVIKGLINRS
jgi:hypothetical protein